MKVIVAYSGGKDSQACLIWAVEKFGCEKKVAVFCDTNWEKHITYQNIITTTSDLGVKLITLKSKKYDGMEDMAMKKGRFASTKARFCTEELKSKPLIDYVLSQDDHCLIIQGIRSSESYARALMNKQCAFFKFYFEPYNIDPRTNLPRIGKNGQQQKPKKHTYRKKEVVKFKSKYSDDILRPVFDWDSQQVINYIIAHGQDPNPLYSQGFSRVGCFPCFMSRHNEVKEILSRYPKRFEEIKKIEKKVGSSFFKIDFIPKRFQTGKDEKSGKTFTTSEDIEKYINAKNATADMFETEGPSCMSFYNLCE